MSDLSTNSDLKYYSIFMILFYQQEQEPLNFSPLPRRCLSHVKHHNKKKLDDSLNKRHNAVNRLIK